MGNALLTGPGGAPERGAPSGVEVRRLQPADLGAVGHAYWSAYVGTPDAMSRVQAEDDVVAAWDGQYGRLLHAACLGAWCDGELAGAVLTVEDAPWPDVPPGPFIIDLFVVPTTRRRGVGRALVAAVQHRVRSRVALRVDDDARAARALYASLGFQPVRAPH